MKTKPILFSGPMVRAILEGRKTQTRRVLKLQPLGANMVGIKLQDGTIDGDGSSLPYRPGDLLWVREAWNVFGISRDMEVSWPLGEIPTRDHRLEECRSHTVVDYPVQGLPGWDGGKGPWRPSIHMPRWASRITLEVTNVRVQRVQDITSADAISEGIRPHADCVTIDCDTTDPREDFRSLWDSINAKRGFGWGANPWVVAVTFKPHLMNVDTYLAQKVAA